MSVDGRTKWMESRPMRRRARVTHRERALLRSAGRAGLVVRSARRRPWSPHWAAQTGETTVSDGGPHSKHGDGTVEALDVDRLEFVAVELLADQ